MLALTIFIAIVVIIVCILFLYCLFSIRNSIKDIAAIEYNRYDLDYEDIEEEDDISTERN